MAGEVNDTKMFREKHKYKFSYSEYCASYLKNTPKDHSDRFFGSHKGRSPQGMYTDQSILEEPTKNLVTKLNIMCRSIDLVA